MFTGYSTLPSVEGSARVCVATSVVCRQTLSPNKQKQATRRARSGRGQSWAAERAGI